jgi:hypothetical protein
VPICDEDDGLTLHMSNSHKVMTALIVMVPSKSFCGDFSAISWTHTCIIEQQKNELSGLMGPPPTAKVTFIVMSPPPLF